MLSKQTGPSQFVYASTLTTVTGTVTLSTFDGSIPRKVRVAVSNSPVLIHLGDNPGNSNSNSILMPVLAVEHFTLENTTTATYTAAIPNSLTALISFTPVA